MTSHDQILDWDSASLGAKFHYFSLRCGRPKKGEEPQRAQTTVDAVMAAAGEHGSLREDTTTEQLWIMAQRCANRDLYPSSMIFGQPGKEDIQPHHCNLSDGISAVKVGSDDSTMVTADRGDRNGT